MQKVETKLGLCVICGERVISDDSYLKSAEGYCHKNCVVDAPVFA